MIKWTSIGGFHNVRKVQKDYPHLFNGEITYRAKVKLHGTCAGVSVHPDGQVQALSRTAVLNEKEDNAGFSKLVASTGSFWHNLHTWGDRLTVFGEWCGPGIQKGTAINQIPSKSLAVFAIQIGESVPDEFEFDHARLVVEPTKIAEILESAGELPENVHVLPWHGEAIVVEYGNAESMQSAVDAMNVVVETVEGTDPWVKDTFGVDGMGEGVVYYPVSFSDEATIDRHEMATFSFKAKGEKHKVVKTKQAVQIDPEVAASIDEFVTLVVTDARLEQGAREVAGGELVFDQKNIGPFLKWFNGDVMKETADELAASGLEWKQVAKSVSGAARSWYLTKFEAL